MDQPFMGDLISTYFFCRFVSPNVIISDQQPLDLDHKSKTSSSLKFQPSLSSNISKGAIVCLTWRHTPTGLQSYSFIKKNLHMASNSLLGITHDCIDHSQSSIAIRPLVYLLGCIHRWNCHDIKWSSSWHCSDKQHPCTIHRRKILTSVNTLYVLRFEMVQLEDGILILIIIQWTF